MLHDISFQLRNGERLGVLGANGSGKSTLIRILSGAEKPSSGVIESDMSISWPLALSGGITSNLTGMDNVRFICRVYNVPFEKVKSFIIEFSGLGDYLWELVRCYSTGMRSRLAFAVSMAIHFDCYLIDEVTAVGDHNFNKKCQEILLKKKVNSSLIMVSHVPKVIKEYCNRFSVLDRGYFQLFPTFEDAYKYYNIGLQHDPEDANRPKPARRP